MKKYILHNGVFVVFLPEGRCYYYLTGMDDTETVMFGRDSYNVNTVVGYERFRQSNTHFFINPTTGISVADAYNNIMTLGLDRHQTNNSNKHTSPNQKPTCDCGGRKCNTPCFEWCSTRRGA